MRRIGLTGGIGTGKSTVAGIFNELGAIPVIDADRIARDLRSQGGEAEPHLLKRFNTTDPTLLRKLLIEDLGAKRDLEAILHPLILKKSEEAFNRAEKEHPTAPFLIYEASLLIESGRTSDFDAIIVVTSPLPDRIARITSRDRVPETQAQKMIQSQNSDSFRLNHADYHIENSGNLEDLRAKVLKVLDQIRSA